MNRPTSRPDKALERVYASSLEQRVDDDARIVIFSDLHMGNGSWTDDFLHNGEMFREVLARRYFDDDSTLILNGDVEELQRFSRRAIAERWQSLYALFCAFHQEGRLIRIVGNHDLANLGDMDCFGSEEPREGVVLNYKGNRRQFQREGIEALVSDYEPFASRAAVRCRLPVLSFCYQAVSEGTNDQ